MSFLVCFVFFCASLWLSLFHKHVAQRRLSKSAFIIYLFAAKESFLHDALQWSTIVRRDFVAVEEGGCGDGKMGVGVPDDEIRVVARCDGALS